MEYLSAREDICGKGEILVTAVGTREVIGNSEAMQLTGTEPKEPIILENSLRGDSDSTLTQARLQELIILEDSLSGNSDDKIRNISSSHEDPKNEVIPAMGDFTENVGILKRKRKGCSGAQKRRRRAAKLAAMGVPGNPTGALQLYSELEAPSFSMGTQTSSAVSKYPRAEGKEFKRPNVEYSKVAQGGIIKIVPEGYPEAQLPVGRLTDIQAAIGRLVDDLPDNCEVVPQFVDCYFEKGAAIVICQDKISQAWLSGKVPEMKAWEDSKLKVIRMEALPTFKRVMAWFPGPPVEVDVILRRLVRQNENIDTKDWRVLDHKVEPKGMRLVLGVETSTAERLQQKKLFCGTGQATFRLIGTVTENQMMTATTSSQ